jgi:hypothetical protein
LFDPAQAVSEKGKKAMAMIIIFFKVSPYGSEFA